METTSQIERAAGRTRRFWMLNWAREWRYFLITLELISMTWLTNLDMCLITIMDLIFVRQPGEECSEQPDGRDWARYLWGQMV